MKAPRADWLIQTHLAGTLVGSQYHGMAVVLTRHSRRLLRSALLVLAAGPLAGGATAAGVQGIDELARAEARLAASDYDGALEILSTLEPTEADTPATSVHRQVVRAEALAGLGRYDAAMAAADELEPVLSRAGMPALRFRVHAVRGLVWRVRARPMQAVRQFEDSLDWAQQSENASLVARAYSGLASAHQDLGDWSRVLHYAQLGLDADPNASDAAHFRYRILRGIAYYEFQDGGEARHSFTAALELAERLGDRRSIALALGELGLVSWEFDADRDVAVDHFDRALHMAREIGAPDLQVTWLLNSGNVFRDLDERDEALRRYRAALEIERMTGQSRSTPHLLKNIAQVLRRDGEHEEAERLLLEAVERADAARLVKVQWQARMELGQLCEPVDPGRAERYYLESLDHLEAHQRNVLLEDFRAGALSRSLAAYDPYDLYLTFLVGQDQLDQAFAIAERARARAFLDTLATAREPLADLIPDSFLEAETAALQRISTRQAELRTEALAASERAAILEAVTEDEEQLTTLRLQLAAEHPQVSQVRYPRIWTIGELQAEVVGPEDTILLYFLGRSASLAWVIDREAVRTLHLPGRQQIDGAVREHLERLATPGLEHADAGARLYELLGLDRLEGLPKNSRLIVVPHGILHYLPFEALVDGAGRYLVERFAVSYAPSASSYAYLRERPASTQAPSLVLAIGSPLVEATAAGMERQLEVQHVGFLKPLPYASQELDQIEDLFGPASQVLDGEHATEGALARAPLARARVLHFATHGLIDEQQPGRSGLALTAEPPLDDGILQMREIFRLRLDAALVTLSACQTALGKHVNGEGLVGLSRAFFYAGANAVMASLWNVNDASTARFMTSFYGGLRDGLAIDRAARSAKLAFLAGESDLRHPYYWAPFVVTGNGQVAIDLPDAPLWGGLQGMTAAVLAALIGVVSWRLASRRRERTRSASTP